MSENYSFQLQREQLIQDLIKRQYGEIAKQSILSEKRITEILSKIITDYKEFYKIHTYVDFSKINSKFYKKLCEIVSQLYYYEDKLKITNHLLENQYTKMMLLLISKRKQIFNDIILNALETETEKEIEIDFAKVIKEITEDEKENEDK